MNTETTTKEIINPTLVDNKKGFVGLLLSIGGTIFMLAGIMFFISLICALYLRLDILIAFVIGSLVTGIAAFGIGNHLLSKK